MSTCFVESGGIFSVSSTRSINVHEKLPAQSYLLQFVPPPFGGGFQFQPMPAFQLPPKFYGDTEAVAQRIFDTYNHRQGSTGVLLSGEKGSGKTLTAKLVSHIAQQHGIPTVIVNASFRGDSFSQLLASITQPCVILIDEFEKVYKKDEQNELLTLLDGVFSSRKLFLFTVNDKWAVNTHMHNRPGRIYYHIEFDGLSLDFIREYAEDRLNHKANIDGLVTAATLFDKFNFDMLQSLVEEMNRYEEPAGKVLRFLNAKPFSTRLSYTYTLTIDGVPALPPNNKPEWSGDVMKDDIYAYYRYDNGYKDEDGNPRLQESAIEFEPKDIVFMGKDGTVIYRTDNGGDPFDLDKDDPLKVYELTLKRKLDNSYLTNPYAYLGV